MDNFSALKQGQWVKVKGMTENGDFVAHEIKIRPAGEQSVMEGKLVEINTENPSISLMNVSVGLNEDVVIKNVARQAVELNTLQVGEIVKVKGNFDANEGFKPVKLKLQESKGIDYNELQGFIDNLNEDSKTVDVLGVKVSLNDNTEVEGF
ncbi:MAG: DUF5666 domain-containing protein [bacterium]